MFLRWTVNGNVRDTRLNKSRISTISAFRLVDLEPYQIPLTFISKYFQNSFKNKNIVVNTFLNALSKCILPLVLTDTAGFWYSGQAAKTKIDIVLLS